MVRAARLCDHRRFVDREDPRGDAAALNEIDRLEECEDPLAGRLALRAASATRAARRKR